MKRSAFLKSLLVLPFAKYFLEKEKDYSLTTVNTLKGCGWRQKYVVWEEASIVAMWDGNPPEKIVRDGKVYEYTGVEVDLRPDYDIVKLYKVLNA